MPLRLVSGFAILLKTLTVQNNNQAITFTSSAGMKMNTFGVMRIEKIRNVEQKYKSSGRPICFPKAL